MTIPGSSLPPPHFSLLLAKAIRQQILSLSSCSRNEAAGTAAVPGAGQPVAPGTEGATRGALSLPAGSAGQAGARNP